MAEKKDHWSSEAYQHSASFVPKLATKILQWLDPQKDDVILDIGCGDGVVNIQLQGILAQGSGSIHGTDASPAMIEAATRKAAEAGASKCTFEVVDALSLSQTPHLQNSSFSKLFSNAALHWILKCPPASQAQFFAAALAALSPGGTFAFEMGGLGNVSEMRAALLSSVARRVGLARAVVHDPWFFPDEAWATQMLEQTVGGWKVDRVEREYRPTLADEGGVEGWVRLFGAKFFEAVPEGREREECVREVVDVLDVVCRNPSGGFHLGYVRLRVLARKL
ncbi:S-adenosyl-L-methionine-dependent methyltransferase [Jackrogersella minutella]|nr:S-adenosyl-L-methionine-dependent methyltransferase [Jackrogersella minutella]